MYGLKPAAEDMTTTDPMAPMSSEMMGANGMPEWTATPYVLRCVAPVILLSSPA